MPNRIINFIFQTKGMRIISKIGWVKVHRKILDWCWYDDPKTFKLFIHLLLKVNFRQKDWRGITVKVGEFISSYKHLSEQTGLSIQEVKTALSKLEKTGEVKRHSTNKYTVFTVINYLKYQQTRTIMTVLFMILRLAKIGTNLMKILEMVLTIGKLK